MTHEQEDAKEQSYAQWLMNQPEAMICNGDTLLRRMEQQWHYEEFERWYANK